LQKNCKKAALITCSFLLFIIFANPAIAEQFRTIPITPSYQLTSGPDPSIKLSIGEQQAPERNTAEQPEQQRPAPEGTSEFEKFVSGNLSPAVSTSIRQFGYDLFRQPPSTFAPVEQVPVGPGYVIGPGDEIRITIWGKVEGQWNIAVDRDGSISLPKVGVLGVAGLTFKELKELLLKEFSRYYTGFQLNISMGSLRTIRVYVVGSAVRPGAYTVSSLSTLISVLFQAGGPSKNGTLRDIQVKRNGRTVVHFDMYDFLLKGDKSSDARLMPEDVIFIPPIGPLVAVAGMVNRPAIYELKGEKTVLDLMKMAGGLSDTAFRDRVQIERIVDNNLTTVFETNLSEARDMDLRAGDVVKVFPVVQDRRIVRISGAVHREGEFGFRRGMTLRELVSMAGGLKYYAYGKEAELTRVHVTDEGPRTEKIMVDLDRALSDGPEGDIQLKENDYIFVRTVPEWRLYQTVSVTGEVRFPGTYTIKKGERLSSVIERAGGVTDKAYLRGAVFTREAVRKTQQDRIQEMADRLERELVELDAVALAEALSPEDVEVREAAVKRKRAFLEKLRGIRAMGRMAIKVAEPGALKGTPYDIELKEGDSLFIPADPKSVIVMGAVYNQAVFIYSGDNNYEHYIDLAGGYTENADKKNAYIIKADGSAVRVKGGSLAWDGDSNMWKYERKVETGDTIVVPQKLYKIAWLREIKDITQILYQIAVTAGVLIVAF
jgi:protein involved in polysaccharide export with SLBB domain